MFAYIGSRRKGPSSWTMQETSGYGIGVYRFKAGTLQPVATVAPELSIGHLCLDADRSILYAVHEAMTLPNYHLGGGGMVVAFRIEEDGRLTEISRTPSFGSLPCFASLSLNKTHLLVAHHTGHTPVTRAARHSDGSFHIELDYDQASVVAFQLTPTGKIGSPSDIWTTNSVGARPSQTHSQLHSVTRVAGNRFVVCDKGGDRIEWLDFDEAKGQIRSLGGIDAPEGSSPRYSVAHPDGETIFINFETAPEIRSYRGTKLETCTPSVPDPSPKIMQSDIILNSDGSRLYTLQRGLEAVSVFDTTTMELLACIPLSIRNLRGCCLSPCGLYLLVAGLQSNSIGVYKLDANGIPVAEGHFVTQTAPACIVFACPTTASTS